MRLGSVHSKSAATPSTSKAAAKSADTKPATQPKAGWGGTSAKVSAELTKAFASPGGRAAFAEIFENQMNKPDAKDGFAWNGNTKTKMQWTFQHTAVGDASLTVSIKGRTLIVENDASGGVGRVPLKSAAPEEIAAAAKKAFALARTSER